MVPYLRSRNGNDMFQATFLRGGHALRNLYRVSSLTHSLNFGGEGGYTGDWNHLMPALFVLAIFTLDLAIGLINIVREYA